MSFRVILSLFHKATGNNNPAHARKMNKSKTLSNIWDSACFVGEEDEGMDWWDRWTAEDEAHALWVAEADGCEATLARSFTASDAYEVNAMREAEEAAEPEAEAETEADMEMGAEAEEWLWADEGKWLQAQAKALLEIVLE